VPFVQFYTNRVSPRSRNSMPEAGMADKPLISIVDDDASVREALESLIRSLGFAVECFPSAEDFLRFHHDRPATCLIADVQMPGMSGIDLYHRMVASGASIPTILITAYPNDQARARALRAGVSAYLAKPFDERELDAHLQVILGPRQAPEGSL
jgi:FixJ family two-component response regulator